MGRSKRRCRGCGHQVTDGWYISGDGWCRPCAVARAVAQVEAHFPPDPVPLEPEWSPELATSV